MSLCCGYFLGTGSIPVAERNSQSILLQLPGTSILVDCGEGTQRQVLKVGARCADLSGVFLTHRHIDHIYGIGGVVYAALLHTDLDRLTIYGPAPALEKARPLTAVGATDLRDHLEWVEVAAGDVVRSAYWQCTCFSTFHTETSLGYAFEVGGKKVAFLGDVGVPDVGLPDPLAVKAIASFVENADVLVSDAAHISPVEAARIACKAQVKALYLMPVSWDDSEQQARQQASAVFSNVYVPDDLDRFTVELQSSHPPGRGAHNGRLLYEQGESLSTEDSGSLPGS
jgi:ribonuclease BN (tRNA processing enzyme)